MSKNIIPHLLSMALVFGSTAVSAGNLKQTVNDTIVKQTLVVNLGGGSYTDDNLIDFFAKTDVIMIHRGIGGKLDGMIKTLKYLDMHPTKLVVIDGVCSSACTLLLSRPKNVVYTEHAVFQFHSAAYHSCDNGKDVVTLSPDGNRKMLAVFPFAVKEWIKSNKAFSSITLKDMSNESVKEFYPNQFIASTDLPQLAPIPNSNLPKTTAVGAIQACVAN